jgi:hypothetical protein
MSSAKIPVKTTRRIMASDESTRSKRFIEDPFLPARAANVACGAGDVWIEFENVLCSFPDYSRGGWP